MNIPLHLEMVEDLLLEEAIASELKDKKKGDIKDLYVQSTKGDDRTTTNRDNK